MAEGTKRPAARRPASAPEVSSDQADHPGAAAERRLGRVVAASLPVACLVAAVIVGFVASVASALLVVASGALLGAIALLWASVRTLSGEAPLPEGLELVAANSHDVDGLAEQKRRVLRALKDLDSERAIGRIDVADYEAIAARYRDEAKALMRRMDEQVAPALAEAERLARDFASARGKNGAPADSPPVEAPAGQAERRQCASCGTSNEPGRELLQAVRVVDPRGEGERCEGVVARRSLRRRSGSWRWQHRRRARTLRMATRNCPRDTRPSQARGAEERPAGHPAVAGAGAE